MELRDYFADILRSIAFLSRFSVPARVFAGHDGSLSQTVRAFPAAGVLILVPSALSLLLLMELGADPMLAAIVALAIQTVTTGALHEDGLADSADGLFGGRDRDHALEIMKDSRIGSYGTVALILGFGLRAAAIAAIAHDLPPTSVALALLAIGSLSRMMMVWHWSSLPSARAKGVAANAGMPEKPAFRMAILVGTTLFAILLWPVTSIATMALVLGLASLAAAGFTAHVSGKLGGHTGDTIGATQQICEAVALAALATSI
ncbi:adenosylcobinamide-GDP ribazoletransferase [Rhizobium sp. RU36D]|uniref:adenosylcobinamide-GDP ribazoletransferase n=1 Tax=Rhizobium sp. RU36D TaxID=1907415 RepID=UPI0009D8CE35|nr:adenosylcobinamide-GDP ribazoletransferase [Rhizobium sp. RU36D]SMC80374.1 cobalamin-5'-phosphate synthase [Rhizobium sp. RU36D]